MMIRGQLGLGDTGNRNEPQDSVIDLGDFEPKDVGCGYQHCCSLSFNRTIKWYVDCEWLVFLECVYVLVYLYSVDFLQNENFVSFLLN